MDFHTPTEDLDVSLKQEEIPPQQEEEENTLDVLESLKPTEEPREPTQPDERTKEELQTETESELADQIRKEDLPPEESSHVQQQTIASPEVVEDAAELEPVSRTEKFLETLRNEKEEPPKKSELFEQEKTVISELPEEKVVEVTGEESFKGETEAFQDPCQVLSNSR